MTMEAQMKLLACVLWVLLAALPVAAEDLAPTTPELIEDLRILSIINVVKPTRDQSTKLAAVAASAKAGLDAIEAEAKAKLEKERERLLAAREKVLRGG